LGISWLIKEMFQEPLFGNVRACPLRSFVLFPGGFVDDVVQWVYAKGLSFLVAHLARF
jgi:hypothetical protein